MLDDRYHVIDDWVATDTILNHGGSHRIINSWKGMIYLNLANVEFKK